MSSVRRPASWIGIRCAGAQTRRRPATEHGRLIGFAVAGDAAGYAALLRTHTAQELSASP